MECARWKEELVGPLVTVNRFYDTRFDSGWTHGHSEISVEEIVQRKSMGSLTCTIKSLIMMGSRSFGDDGCNDPENIRK